MAKGPRRTREPLDRHRVAHAALKIADREGLGAVTMRRVGDELGVEAMSLYHHFRGKEELVAAMSDLLIDEIDVPPPTDDWKADIRARALAARAMRRRHPWAPALLGAGPRVGAALFRYLDGIVAILRGAGFSRQLTHHAMHVLDSRLLGFTRDLLDPAEMSLRMPKSETVVPFELPAMAEAFVGVKHDEEREFAFALDLILHGLERARDTVGV
ncbi:MAG TPA: TetR/AcrR family transcriptional regulator [Candidatus Limnocylindria bacterium]